MRKITEEQYQAINRIRIDLCEFYQNGGCGGIHGLWEGETEEYKNIISGSYSKEDWAEFINEEN